MAVDTRQKRFSMMNFVSFASLHLDNMFEVDGAINRDDRQHLIDLYSGVIVTVFPPIEYIRVKGSYMDTLKVEGSYADTLKVEGSYITTLKSQGDYRDKIKVKGSYNTTIKVEGDVG